MNENQRNVLVVAGVVIALMLLFPPHEFRGLSTGYQFLLSKSYGVVNVGQLLAQWAGVGLLAGIAWFLARN